MSYEYMTGMGLTLPTLPTTLAKTTLAVPTTTLTKTLLTAPPTLPVASIQEAVQQESTALDVSSTTQAQAEATIQALDTAQAAVQTAAIVADTGSLPSDAEVLASLRRQLENAITNRELLRAQLANATTVASREIIQSNITRINNEIRDLENRIAIEGLPPQQRISTINTLLTQARGQLAQLEAAYANIHPFDTAARDLSNIEQGKLRQKISRLESDLARAQRALQQLPAPAPVVSPVFMPDTATVAIAPPPPPPPPPPAVLAPTTVSAAEAARKEAELRAQIEKLERALSLARSRAAEAAAAQQKSYEEKIVQLQKELTTASAEQARVLQAQISQLAKDKTAAENASLDTIRKLQNQIDNLEATKSDAAATAQEKMVMLQNQVENLTQQLMESQEAAAAAKAEAQKATAVANEVVPWYLRYKWYLIGAVLVGGYLYTRNR